MKYEAWNPANEFTDKDEYIAAMIVPLMTLGVTRIKAVFRLLEIEWDAEIYDQSELLVKALRGCSESKLNELEGHLFGVLGK